MKVCKALKQIDNAYPVLNWKELLSKGIPMDFTASIVIPIYNSETTILHVLNSIELQTDLDHLHQVILVDDMSTDNTVSIIEENLSKYSYNINLVKADNKLYGGGARNIGVKASNSPIVLFVDSDIMLDPEYIRYHLALHYKFENLITLSFRSTISLEEYLKLKNKFPIEVYEKEFRLNSRIKEKYLKEGKPKSLVGKDVNLFQDTDGFRRLGFGHKYFWNLPEVCSTCSISYRKEDYEKVGGMLEDMIGWGYDDIALAAKVLTLGRWVIPIHEVGTYHIKHAFRTKSIDDELDYNLEIYDRLLKSDINW